RDLPGVRREDGPHHRGHRVGQRLRARDRRRAAAHALRRAQQGRAQARRQSAGHHQGRAHPRVQRRRAARPAVAHHRPQLSHLHRPRFDRRAQPRPLRARHRHPGDLPAARRHGSHARLLPGQGAGESQPRHHAWQDVSPGRPTELGIPDAARRCRRRARTPNAAIPARRARRARGSTRRPAGHGTVGRVTLPLVEELAPAPDPAAACAALLDQPYLLFLDSATAHGASPDAGGRDRYSFLAADPAVVVQCTSGRAERIDRRDGSRTPIAHNALAEVRRLLRPFHAPAVSGLPPFQGGAAGYIAYDWGSVLERLPSPRYHDLAIADLVLGLYDCLVAWDHDAHRAWIISSGLPDEGAAREERARRRLTELRGRLARGPVSAPPAAGPLQLGTARAPSYAVSDVAAAASVELRSSFTRRGYLDAVTRVHEYIVAGDIFQANLSQRLEAPLREPT